MKLFERIMQHMDLLTGLTDASRGLLAAATNGKVELIEQITDNRERLISIIKTFQSGIEDDVKKLKAGDVTRAEIEILKTWSNEVNQIVLLNDKIDQEVVTALTTQKEQTTQEIASVFKNRQSVKGYNLSSVKK
jgi:hypothetical protein